MVFRTPAKFTVAHGSFTFDKASGSWTDTMDNSNDEANALTASKVMHDNLTATAADGSSPQVVGATRTDVNKATAIGGQGGGGMIEQAAPPSKRPPYRDRPGQRGGPIR